MKTLCSLVFVVLCLSGAAYSQSLNVSAFCYSMKTKDAEPFLKAQDTSAMGLGAMKEVDALVKAHKASYLGSVTAPSTPAAPVMVKLKDVNLQSHLTSVADGKASVNASVKVKNAKLDGSVTVDTASGEWLRYMGSTFTDSTKTEMMLVFVAVKQP